MLLQLYLKTRKKIHDQHPEKKILIGLQITEIFEKNDENDHF